MFEVYLKDERYKKQIEEALNVYTLKIARQIFNMNLYVKLEKVAIGGGISNQTVFIDFLKNNLRMLSERLIFKIMKFPVTVPEIVKCEFKSEANLIGALEYFNEQQNVQYKGDEVSV